MGLVNRVMRTLTKKAESEVARLEQAVVRWQSEAEQKRQELAELEAAAGERIFSGQVTPRELAVDKDELRFSVDGALAAAKAAERHLLEARQELALAQAAEKRDQAARLTAEADALQEKVDALLGQLTELDGATYVPQPELFGAEREAAVNNGGYELPVQPRADVLRDQAAALLGEAQRLEERVAEERRQIAEQETPIVPRATIRVPAWDDVDSDSHISCSVGQGPGSATFEVQTSGNTGTGLHPNHFVVTLPDEEGRRHWGRPVRIPPGGSAEVRCGGQVIAKEQRPGRLVGNGLGSWWVER